MYGLGFFMNKMVEVHNNGQMPVLVPGGGCAKQIDPEDIIHTCMTATTHLKVLADWIYLGGTGIASPGDFLLWAGDYIWIPALFAWFVLVMKDHNSKL
jgi:hypothetical protein